MNNEKDIVKLLKQYRPAKPDKELHDRIFNNPINNNHSRLLMKWLAIAASIAIISTVSLISFTKTESNTIEQPKKVANSFDLIQIERNLERTGQVAQLMAIADILAKQPGGKEYAIEQYRDIIKDYPDMAQAKQAKQTLITLMKGV